MLDGVIVFLGVVIGSPPFQGGDGEEGCEAPDAPGVVDAGDSSASGTQCVLDRSQ